MTTNIDAGTFDAAPETQNLPQGSELRDTQDPTFTEELTATERKREIARANGRLGGRPRKPVAEPVAPVASPQTSAEADALIALEVVKPAPNFKAIHVLEGLRDSYKEAEALARQDRADAEQERRRAEHEQRQADAKAKEEQLRAERKAAYQARMEKKAAQDKVQSWESASDILNALCTDLATPDSATAAEAATAIKMAIANLRAQLAVAQTEHAATKAQLVTAMSTGAACTACNAKLQQLRAELESLRSRRAQ